MTTHPTSGAADLPEATASLIERLEDAVYEWGNYVDADHAPRPLTRHGDPHIKAIRAELERLHALAAGQAVAPAEPLHITHGPLMRHAAALLRSRKPVLPDHEGVAAELERAVDGHPTPSGAPSAEWLEVARIAAAHPSPPEGMVAEQALRKVLAAVQRYLPPDGPSAKDTLTEIIEIVDPWPLGQLDKS